MTLQVRKRILLLASRSPVPPLSGERLKNLNLLRILSKTYDVDFLFTNEKRLSDGEIAELQKWSRTVNVIYFSKWAKVSNLLLNIFNGKPFQINYFYSKKMHQRVRNIERDYDIIVATLVRTAEYCDSKNIKTVLDMSDSIAQNYLSSVDKMKNLFWKLLYAIEGKRLWNYEQQIVSRFRKVFLFNQEEIGKFSDRSHLVWVPHGVKSELVEMPIAEHHVPSFEISFIGKMDYRPNVEACLWFAENVLPLLPSEYRFVIIGVSPAPEIRVLATRLKGRVEVTGFVENPYLRIRDSHCVVAPMQTGGGIQNKILEAMVLGQVVIASSLGVRALTGVMPKDDLLVEDEPSSIVKEILRLQLNLFEKKRIGINARKYVIDHFTWEAFEKIWVQTLNSVLEENRRP